MTQLFIRRHHPRLLSYRSLPDHLYRAGRERNGSQRHLDRQVAFAWYSEASRVALDLTLGGKTTDSFDDALIANLQARPQRIDSQWLRGRGQKFNDAGSQSILRRFGRVVVDGADLK